MTRFFFCIRLKKTCFLILCTRYPRFYLIDYDKVKIIYYLLRSSLGFLIEYFAHFKYIFKTHNFDKIYVFLNSSHSKTIEIKNGLPHLNHYLSLHGKLLFYPLEDS